MRRLMIAILIIFTGGILMAEPPIPQTPQRELTVTSPVVRPGMAMPEKYTCDGANVSPPFQWKGVPAAAKSVAVIVDDPDAPGKTWVHWVLFNWPVGDTSLAENIPQRDKLPNGAVQGRNDFGHAGYGGPCPPKGTHRYFFRVYALDCQLDLTPAATRADVDQAMAGHVVASGELMATYQRSK